MPVFELSGPLAHTLPDLLLGPWTRAAPDLVAFDAPSDQPESLWRVDLAPDDAASRDALTDAERSIARTHAALARAPRQLDQTLAELARAARTPRPSGSRHPTQRSDVPRLEPDTPGDLEQALRRLADLVRGRARIETRIDTTLAACSITTLCGNTELWTSASPSPACATLHTRSLAIALRTRHAWARTLALLLAYGSRLAALHLHAGISVLPQLWGLLRDLLREVQPG